MAEQQAEHRVIQVRGQQRPQLEADLVAQVIVLLSRQLAAATESEKQHAEPEAIVEEDVS
jgi:hypothetical protein